MTLRRCSMVAWLMAVYCSRAPAATRAAAPAPTAGPEEPAEVLMPGALFFCLGAADDVLRMEGISTEEPPARFGVEVESLGSMWEGGFHWSPIQVGECPEAPEAMPDVAP